MKKILSALALISCLSAGAQELYKNASLPLETRLNDLISRLTLEEKISLLGFQSKAVPRVDIPQYNWWNEALHGVARAGQATVFPQAIAMSASFNNELLQEVSSAISTEARAKFNLAVANNRRLQYMGLTFWSPNINIFRDPRWGRGQETYGEDPYLTGTMGTAFIRGLQGNDPRYLKTSACAKHFAVHSGPEAGRHTFNAIVDEKDLRETYLYAFKKLVDAGVESVMCGYNRLNGEPCCTGPTLLQTILKKEWNFKGHVVTDCWALEDIWLRHKVSPNSVTVAADAIKAGVNMDCSNMLQDDALKAVQQGLLTEQDINNALAGNMRTRFKLGLFDGPDATPFSKYGADSVSNDYHVALARKMAQQSMVLLKNSNSILPLDKKKLGALMVVGPNAGSLDALVGNYHGMSNQAVTFAQGITAAVGPGAKVDYDQGTDYSDTSHFGGVWAASNAEVTIAVIGLTPVFEGEEGDAFLAAGGGDKMNLSLPASHIAYLKALRKGTKTPLIAVVTAGSAVDLTEVEKYADAIVLAWYPGEQGGNALADILFGEVSPSGHLPVTFYKSFDDLPPYESYATKGRTYRYFTGDVQYPFGYGLSYSKFDYSWNQQPAAPKKVTDTLSFSVTVKNIGTYNGDEAVQVYVKYPSLDRMPVKELKAFKKLHVDKDGTAIADFKIPMSELQKWDLVTGQWKLYNGTYSIVVGSSSKDEKLVSSFKVGK